MLGRAHREHALLLALPHDPRQQGCETDRRALPAPLAHDGVLVREPDAHEREQRLDAQVHVLRLPSGDAAEDALQLLEGREAGIGGDRDQRLGHVVDHPLHQRFEQGALRVEVVVEGAPGGVRLVEDVLEAHLLVPLRVDEALCGLHEGVPSEGVGGRVDYSCQVVLQNKPTTGLF